MRLYALLLPWIVLCAPASLAQMQTQAQAPPAEKFAAGPSGSEVASTSLEPVPRAPLKPVSPPFTRRPNLTVGASTLGGQVQLTFPLVSRVAVRAGANYLAFGTTVNVDGMSYDARAHAASGQLTVDLYPMRSGFHISPGLFYFNNRVTGRTSVVPGQVFALGGTGFISSPQDPVAGQGTIQYARSLAPMLTIGFTDLPPRMGHISIPIEFGAAYTGDAKLAMQLNGTACTLLACFSFNSNPDAVASLTQQVAKVNHYLAKVPIYPIVSLGVTYHF